MMLLLSVILLALSSRVILGQGFNDSCTIIGLSGPTYTAKCAGTTTQINLDNCVGNNLGFLVGQKKSEPISQFKNIITDYIISGEYTNTCWGCQSIQGDGPNLCCYCNYYGGVDKFLTCINLSKYLPIF
jgi:hypothetical protein